MTGTTKISYSGGEYTVTDGPFAEAKELIGGWALTQFDTHEEDFPPGFEEAGAASEAANSL